MAMRGHPLGGSSTQQLETPHGRFVFKRSAQLGEGCAAKVYEGRDLESGQFVAVKVYKDIGRTSLHCFHNAIQVGKLLNGKSGKRLQDRTDRGLFVEVVAHSANHGVPGPDLGFLFHILELGGPSLEDVLATRYRDASALSMAELRDLHWSLFSMAYKLESLNLVHLDIKPSNIVSFPQSGNPQWKLVDLDCVVPAGAARCVTELRKCFQTYHTPRLKKPPAKGSCQVSCNIFKTSLVVASLLLVAVPGALVASCS
ncbi:Inhibitor of nuclear factor kappa-B kinase subunit epsilon [Durusdinium trenchii]|uniref:Inhibitor of nuclear factor kappa-B kinase subunit epsilon n=1 Tax=Durusdinium trenchii TaxID=1381693 RepID=A0ABP0J7P2_9DINO